MTRFTILMLRNLLLAAGLLWAPIGMAQTATDDNGDAELTEEQVAELQAYAAEADAFNATLTPVFDEVNLPNAGAKLVLGDDFYYLKSADSRKVLEEAWGNPPDKTILGMIFPKGADAFYSDYAVAVTFEKSGYVSDEDAQDIDFDQLLKQMKKDTAAGSKARIEQGYSGVELVGWATPPSYDAVNKRLLWAKSIRFSDSEDLTLNYNMRFLGRKGVLEFNYIANVEALDLVTEAMPDMIAMAQFHEGHRYSDFNAATDKVAAYGVAGLIAGGVAAKKLGLLGVLLLFLKKGWFIVVAAFMFGRNYIMSLFSKKPADGTGE